VGHGAFDHDSPPAGRRQRTIPTRNDSRRAIDALARRERDAKQGQRNRDGEQKQFARQRGQTGSRQFYIEPWPRSRRALRRWRDPELGMAIEGDLHVQDGFKAGWFKGPEGNVLHIDGAGRRCSRVATTSVAETRWSIRP